MDWKFKKRGYVNLKVTRENNARRMRNVNKMKLNLWRTSILFICELISLLNLDTEKWPKKTFKNLVTSRQLGHKKKQKFSKQKLKIARKV